eukprot:EG_transcript_33509
MSAAPYYPASETPLTIFGSEAGSVLPYPGWQPAATTTPTGGSPVAFAPSVLSAYPSGPQPAPGPAPGTPVPYLSAPALGVAYTAWPLPLAAQPYLGQPVQQSPAPQGFPPLQYPSAQPMPVQLTQSYPLVPSVAKSLGSPFPAPLPVGAATAYFPTPSLAPFPAQPLYPLTHPGPFPSSAPQP